MHKVIKKYRGWDIRICETNYWCGKWYKEEGMERGITTKFPALIQKNNGYIGSSRHGVRNAIQLIDDLLDYDIKPPGRQVITG